MKRFLRSGKPAQVSRGTDGGATIGLARKRVSALLLLMIVGLIAVFARTVYLQSVKTLTLSKWADAQQQNTQELPAVRGNIVDRNGQELAVGDDAVTFIANPMQIKDPFVVAQKIAEILDMKQAEHDQLLARISQDDTGFQYVRRQVPRAKAREIMKLNLEGISWIDEQRRIYPLNKVAAQLLGKVNIDGDGIAGMEMLYDRSLKGTAGKQVVVRDPTGTPIDVLSLQRERDGRDVQLTIDAILQTEVERVLLQTKKKFNAKGASAVVVNPRNGEILAMANVPTFDANNVDKVPSDWLRNRVITDTYEPGSTFKVVTISAVLEEGLVTPTTSFLLKPYIQVADRKIHESHDRPTLRMTVKDILVESSNVGTVTLGLQLGKEKIDYWNRRYGFGHLTGIDFPGEVQGLMLPTDQWSGSTIGNVPIGQGIGVTGIQLVSAYGAIANDGIAVQPHLLKRVEGEPPIKAKRRRVISYRTAKTMRQMFGDVVKSERGTGKEAAIEGYAVAGKTGTANKAEGGVYVRGKYISSFVGFVPAQNPQLVTLVVVDEPSVAWGGVVAAPAFEEINRFALQYMAIPPDGRM